MKLHTRTLIVFIPALAVLITLLCIVSQEVLHNSFVELEDRYTREQMRRILNTLSDQIDTFATITQDYAYWDETYAFMQGRNDDFISEQFANVILMRNKIDILVFVNRGGEIIFEEVFDPQQENASPLPQALRAHLSLDGPLLSRDSAGEPIRGVLLVADRPMVFASMSILTTEAEGPSLGSMIWGYYLGEDDIVRLSELTEIPLEVYNFGDPALPADFQAAQEALTGHLPLFVQPLPDGQVGGYTLVSDLYGNPAIILRAAMPRNIYEQGQRTILVFDLIFLAGSILFGGVTVVLLEKLVISRQDAQLQAERQYRELFEDIDDGILVHDKASNILDVNQALCRRLGYSREEMLRMKIGDIDAPGYASGFEDRLAKQLAAGKLEHIRGGHVTRDGRVILVDVNSTVINYHGQEAVLAVMRDISDLEQTEEMLLQLNDDLVKHNNTLRALHEIGMDINARLDMVELRQRIIDRAMILLNADGANLYLYDATSDVLTAVDGVGAGAKYVGWTIRPGEGLTGRVFQSGKSLAIEDYSMWEGRLPAYANSGFRAVLVVPLRWGNQVLGTLNIQSTHEERSPFDTYDTWLADMFAAQAAVAIQNANLFEAERRQRIIADTLRDVGLILASALNLDETLRRLVEAAQMLFPQARAVTVQFLDSTSQTLQTIAASPGAIFRAERIAFRPGQGIAGNAIAERRVINVSNITADSRFLPGTSEPDFHALLVAPLIIGDHLWGTFSVTANAAGAFDGDDEKLADLLARHAAVAIENAHLYESEQHQREIAETLRDIGVVLTGALRQDDVLKRILEQIARVLPYDAAAVWLADGRGVYRIAVGVGYEKFGVAEQSGNLYFTEENSPVLKEMRRTGRALTIPDTRELKDWNPVEGYEWLRSWAAAPIIASGQFIGQFSLDHSQPGFYGPQHEPILEALSTQFSIAIESARLFEQVQSYAETMETQVEERTAEIVRQQQRIETILLNIGDAIIIVDPQFYITYGNNAFCRMVGLASSEIVGKPASALIHETMSPESLRAQARILQEGRLWRGTLFLRHRDGHAVEVEVNSVPYREEGENNSGFISSARDITAERALERMKGQFMTLVSHQLRTPLTSLKLRLHMLRKTSTDPQLMQRHLDSLEEQTDRLIHMMEKVLSATRLADTDAMDVPRQINGSTLLEILHVRFSGIATEKQISLCVDSLAEDFPALVASESWLSQACYELLENALSYTPPGGSVTFGLDQRMRENRSHIVFWVQDTGPGISAEDLAQLNTPFVPLSPQTLGTMSGMGLGLFIARTVAERHGGRMTVDAGQDGGSVFALWLPM